MASSHSTSGNGLSVDDFDGAGFAILPGEGMNTLKIDRLYDGLGVTSDSFHCHLDRMSSYCTAPIQNAGRFVRRRPPPHRRRCAIRHHGNGLGTAVEFLRISGGRPRPAIDRSRDTALK
jgi:hypothetical protein